jgi:hypothetical protein
LVHVACNRADPKLDSDRQSRHWHDLAVLADHKIGEASLADRALLEDVVGHKSVFFRASYAKYDACLSGGLRLIPGTPLLQALGADYEKMITDGMFEGEPPSFDFIIAGSKNSRNRSTQAEAFAYTIPHVILAQELSNRN